MGPRTTADLANLSVDEISVEYGADRGLLSAVDVSLSEPLAKSGNQVPLSSSNSPQGPRGGSSRLGLIKQGFGVSEVPTTPRGNSARPGVSTVELPCHVQHLITSPTRLQSARCNDSKGHVQRFRSEISTSRGTELKGTACARLASPIQRWSCGHKAKARDAEQRIVKVSLPPEHRGFSLGGRCGKLVVKVHGGRNARVLLDISEDTNLQIPLKPGWCPVQVNGRPLTGAGVLTAILESQRRGDDCFVSFEVDTQTWQGFGQQIRRQMTSRVLLSNHIGGVHSLRDLENLCDEKRLEALRDPELLRLLVEGASLLELEVLLGRKSAHLMQASNDVSHAVKRGDRLTINKVMSGLSREEQISVMAQRDGAGNVALHYATDTATISYLLELGSSCDIENASGRKPLCTYLIRRPQDSEAIKLLAANPADLLLLDKGQICPAMRTVGPARVLCESRLPSWSELLTVLQTSTPCAILPALEALRPPGCWEGVFAFHVFGDHCVWQDGRHTARSRERLGAVWSVLQGWLEKCFQCDEDAEPIVRALLRATKGPCNAELDPREPYRANLLRFAIQLEQSNSLRMRTLFGDLVCHDSQQMKAIPSSVPRVEDVASGSDWDRFGLVPQLRMDVKFPHWLENPDLDAVYWDLLRVGEVGPFEERDGAYDLLRLSDGSSDSSCVKQLHGSRMVYARWFAAWLRGTCQAHLAQVTEFVRRLLGAEAEGDGVFFARQEAKSFSRICEKMIENMMMFGRHLDEHNKPAAENRDTRKMEFLQTAASFVLDILGCTFVADTPEDLMAAYKSLLSNVVTIDSTNVMADTGGAPRLVGIPGTWNGFADEFFAPGGYRDIKLWLDIECPCPEEGLNGPHLLVELQLLLRPLYDLKRWAYLPYEIMRGSFEWSHLVSSWKERCVCSRKQIATTLLKAAIAHGEITPLQIAVSEGKAIKLEDPVLHSAEECLADLLRKVAARFGLNVAVDRCEISVLEAALFEGREAGLEESELHDAKVMLQAERRKSEARFTLASAVERRNITSLREAVKVAQSALLPQAEVLVGLTLLSRKLLDVACESRSIPDLTEAIAHAKQVGLEVGELSGATAILAEEERKTLATALLKRALDACDCLINDPEHVAALRSAIEEGEEADLPAESLWGAKVALAAEERKAAAREEIESALASRQVASLRSSVTAGEVAGLENRELADARTALEEQELLEERRQALASAVRSRKMPSLRTALKEAKRWGVSPSDYREAEEILRFEERKYGARRELVEAVRLKQMVDLEAAIQEGKAVGLDHVDLIAAEELYERLWKTNSKRGLHKTEVMNWMKLNALHEEDQERNGSNAAGEQDGTATAHDVERLAAQSPRTAKEQQAIETLTDSSQDGL